MTFGIHRNYQRALNTEGKVLMLYVMGHGFEKMVYWIKNLSLFNHLTIFMKHCYLREILQSGLQLS